jgi:hypothetical protein
MSSLEFYDYFGKIPIPEGLKDDLLDAKGNPLKSIEPLTHINIFLGSNNSGKSRIIREVIREPIKPIHINKLLINENIRESIEKLRLLFIKTIENELYRSRKRPQNYDSNTILAKDGFRNLRFDLKYLDSLLNPNRDIHELKFGCEEIIKKLENVTFNEIGDSQGNIGVHEHTSNKIKEILNPAYKLFSDEINNLIFNNRYIRVYIPSQRNLRTVYSKAKSKDVISKEYNFYTHNESEEVEQYAYKGIRVENGETFYEEILTNLTTGHKNRRKIEEFEKFLSENFFEGQKIELIPYTTNVTELHIKVGEEQEQPIFNLGDGLQMLIILTWPFFNYDYGIIALEEPELFIHPGLQKKLIEIFAIHKRARNFIFFISTHSNHIIDASQYAQQISLFTVRKELDSKDVSNEKLPKFIVENVGFQDRNALTLLGVSNSSVYLANCTIWVEGITDKMYLSKFINCYLSDKNPKRQSKYEICEKFKEGTHFSFVLSGGDSIIHWDFDEDSTYENEAEKIIAKNLCGKAYVIVDEDNKKNIRRKQKLHSTLGLRFYQLPVVEIENMLSYNTIKATIKSYRSCSNLDVNKMKEPTIKMMKEKRLGYLIDQHILKNFKTDNPKKFASKNRSTIDKKVQFCSKALPYITPSNMTNNSIKLSERLLDFIIENNR